MIRPALFVLAVLLLCCVPARSQSAGSVKTDSAATPHFDPNRDAAADIKDAIALADSTHRHVLLDVGGEWCIWCRRLDTLFRSHADLDSTLHANYVVVKVNFSKENENKEVLSHYPEIPGYPHIFVLDEHGKLLKSQDTGELEAGKHHDPAKVMAFLLKWAPKGEKD
jgi:thiol:disulfide interchange protein